MLAFADRIIRCCTRARTSFLQPRALGRGPGRPAALCTGDVAASFMCCAISRLLYSRRRNMTDRFCYCDALGRVKAHGDSLHLCVCSWSQTEKQLKMGGTIAEAHSRVPIRYLVFCGLVLAVLLVHGAPDVKEGARRQAKPPAVVEDDGQRDAIAREDSSASGEVNAHTDGKPQEAAEEPLLNGAEKTEEETSAEGDDLESDGEEAGGTEPPTSSEQQPPSSSERRPPGSSELQPSEDDDPVEPTAPYVETISAECLRYHNLFRVDQLHEPLPHLHSHSGMDEYVTALLRRSVEAGCRHFDMPSNTPFGANFYATSAEKPTCMGATHLWYRGIDNFHGRYPGTGWQHAGANQFIQMMWPNTEYLACARTRACSQSMNQLLCIYYPGGNVAHETPFSEPTWKDLLERHHRWKRYDEPGGRRDRRPRMRQS